MPGREQVLAAELEDMEKAVYGTPAEEAPEQGEVSAATETVEDQPEEVVQPTPALETQEPVDWEKRFKGIKALYDSKVFSLNNEVASLTRHNADLGKRLATAEQQYQASKSKTSEDYSKALTEEQRDILGEDAVGGMQAMTNAAVKQATEPLLKMIQEFRDRDQVQLEARGKASADEANSTFLSRLRDIAPGYETTDTDPKFQTWMKEVDAASGFSRERVFKTAQTNGDVGRVAQFFNEFEQINGSRKAELQKKITPTTSSATKPADNKPKNNFLLESEVNNFYDSVNRGDFKGTDKDRLAMERKIDQAVMNRAIRPG